MPKPILNSFANESRQRADSLLSLTNDTRSSLTNLSQEEKRRLDMLLRRPRSKEYMKKMSQLDAGGHVHNQKQVNEIISAIQNEFPEVNICGILLGTISKCFLGQDYQVHTLDISGSIIEHYRRGQPLPAGMEKARTIAMSGSYAFIEVYVDCCRAVSSDGSVSVVPY